MPDGFFGKLAQVGTRTVTGATRSMLGGASRGIEGAMNQVGLPSLTPEGLFQTAITENIKLQTETLRIRGMFNAATADIGRLRGEINSLGYTRSQFLGVMGDIGRAANQMGAQLQQTTKHVLELQRAFGVDLETNAAVADSFTRMGNSSPGLGFDLPTLNNRILGSLGPRNRPLLNESLGMLSALQDHLMMGGSGANDTLLRLFESFQGNPLAAGPMAGRRAAQFMSGVIGMQQDLDPLYMMANPYDGTEPYYRYRARAGSLDREGMSRMLEGRGMDNEAFAAMLRRTGRFTDPQIMAMVEDRGLGRRMLDNPKEGVEGLDKVLADMARANTSTSAQVSARAVDSLATPGGLGDFFVKGYDKLIKGGTLFENATSKFDNSIKELIGKLALAGYIGTPGVIAGQEVLTGGTGSLGEAVRDEIKRMAGVGQTTGQRRAKLNQDMNNWRANNRIRARTGKSPEQFDEYQSRVGGDTYDATEIGDRGVIGQQEFRELKEMMARAAKAQQDSAAAQNRAADAQQNRGANSSPARKN